MLSDTPARGRGTPGLRKRFTPDVIPFVRVAMRIVSVVGLLACLVTPAVSASGNSAPAKLIVQRSAASVQHRFAIRPDGPTVTANQTQHFEVLDPQGQSVAVHWNVSGLGCAGISCGTIDDQGTYRTPSKIPQPRVVILEGVLDSNPNYSVLTRIELAPAPSPNVNPAAPRLSAAATQPMPALVGTKGLAPHTSLLPLPNATVPPPVIERQNVAARNLPLIPNAISAPPVVETHIARVSPAPLQAKVTGPPPEIERHNVAARDLPPLARAIAAAPVVERQTVAAGAQLLPMSKPTAPPPVIEKQGIPARDLPPLPNVITSAPSVQRQTIAGGTLPLPMANALAPQPLVERQNVTARDLPPLPNAVAAPPSVSAQVARISPLPSPPSTGVPPVIEKDKASSRDVQPSRLRVNTPLVIEAQIARIPSPPARATLGAPPPSIDKEKAATPGVPVLQAVGAPPPGRKTQLVARGTLAGPLPDSIVAAPTSARITGDATRPLILPVVQQSGAGKTLLSMPDDAPAAQTKQNAPVVTYQDGLLTIDARNATLAEVLKLVAEKSGATIEVPPGTGLERIFEHSGPAPAQDVLARLLNGSTYDFIIVSSPQVPHGPAQVLLSLHRADAPAALQTEVVKPAAPSPGLWTPPEKPAATAVLSVPAVDTASVPPQESMTPEALGEMMKGKARQLRQQLQQQPQQ